MTRYTLFPTAIGWAGLAWSAQGLVGCCLPERDPDVVRKSFARRFADAAEAPPPPDIARLSEEIAALMSGGKPDLKDAVLDHLDEKGTRLEVLRDPSLVKLYNAVHGSDDRGVDI